MRRHGIPALAGRRFRPCTTDSRHHLPIAPNLLNQKFAAAAPNRVWLAGITHIAAGKGWLYLAAVLDLATRKIIGSSMRDHMRTELPLAALMMAAQRQRPVAGLICHSDRGSQYASDAYGKQRIAMKDKPSMGRTSCRYDDAPMERFFHMLKSLPRRRPGSNSFTSGDGRPARMPDAISSYISRATITGGQSLPLPDMKRPNSPNDK